MLLTTMIVHGFAPHDFIKNHAIYQSQKEQRPLQLTQTIIAACVCLCDVKGLDKYLFNCLFYFSNVLYCAIEPVLISANQK